MVTRSKWGLGGRKTENGEKELIKGLLLCIAQTS